MRALRMVMALLAAWLLAAPALAEQPAKALFGKVKAASGTYNGERSFGSYAKGCLAGGEQLAIDGPNWQAMRLSRNRNWGHPRLLSFVQWLAASAAREDGWPGLLVGDMAQPRGGPMDGGHASHQIGLDVDLWLTAMPNHTLSAKERENLSAVSMIRKGTRTIDSKIWTEQHARLIRRAAIHEDVARIFVHPGIKKALCDINWRDRSFLAKVRPWWGHDSHFHVRLACPPGERDCVNQDAPASEDGCGKELAYWLSDEAWKPADPPAKPTPPLTLASLPKACTAIIEAK